MCIDYLLLEIGYLKGLLQSAVVLFNVIVAELDV